MYIIPMSYPYHTLVIPVSYLSYHSVIHCVIHGCHTHVTPVSYLYYTCVMSVSYQCHFCVITCHTHVIPMSYPCHTHVILYIYRSLFITNKWIDISIEMNINK